MYRKQQSVVTSALVNQAMEGGTNAKAWKDIQPDKSYQDIKKKAYIEQKKRSYQQIRQEKTQAYAERQAMPYMPKGSSSDQRSPFMQRNEV